MAAANPALPNNNVEGVRAAQAAAEQQARELQIMGENHQKVMSLIAMLAELSKWLERIWQLIAANMK
jgi:hypothetical protein